MFKKNIVSALIALVILFLSFASSRTFEKLPVPDIPHIDKLVHLGMYFTFMMALIFENRSYLTSWKKYFILSLFPIIFGIAIEFLQTLLTRSRTGDVFDACFNIIGVISAIFIWHLFRKFRKTEFK